VANPAKRSPGNHDPSRGSRTSAADSRAGASDADVGLRPSLGDVDWLCGAVAAGLLVDTLGCSSVAHGRNGCRRRRRRHRHDSYGFGAQPRTRTSLVPITLHQTTDDARLAARMMLRCFPRQIFRKVRFQMIDDSHGRWRHGSAVERGRFCVTKRGPRERFGRLRF
jgi:hypothetical protein